MLSIGNRDRTGVLPSVLSRLNRLDEFLRGESSPGWATLALTVLLGTGFLLWATLKLPIVGGVEGFLFNDWGANLTVQALLDAKYRPVEDFFYPYGLLPLVSGRLAFGLLGRTPYAYLTLVAICHVLVAWGMARFLVATRLGLLAAVFVLLAVPYSLPPTYANLTHGMEAVLLVHALAFQAEGRRPRAMALVALGIFVKPSMAFVYGLILALVETSSLLRSGPDCRSRCLVRSFGPALVVGVLAAIGLAFVFGTDILRQSLLPTTTAVLYDLWDYGFFFGDGRNFWLPRDATIWSYVGTHRGFWLLCTLAVVVAAAVTAVRMIGRVGPQVPDSSISPAPRIGELLLTCVGLHLAFVVFFFGGEVSWLYYPYILTLGVACLTGLGRASRLVLVFLTILLVVVCRTLPREVVDGWRSVGLEPRVAGLWTTGEAAEDWKHVLEQTKGRRTAVLSMSGCAPIIYPQLLPDVSLYLIPGLEDSSSVQRKSELLAKADCIILPTAAAQSAPNYVFLTTCPAFQRILKGCDLVWSGPYFEIYHQPGANLANP